MERTEFSPEHHEVAPMSGFQKILSAHRNRERGAVLVEAAIAIPLLLFVILGSLEFGVGWEAKSATTSGLRSGLLRASTLADDPHTDLRTLQSIIGEVGADKADRIRWVVIFDADPANGDLNSIVDACRDAVLGGPQESFCVGYTRQTLIDIATTTTIDVSDFDPSIDSTCDTGLLDEGQFCATSRIINGDIEIGVAFEYEHSWLTGILPFNSPTFREVQTSSTFAAGGVDITSSNPISAGATTVLLAPGLPPSGFSNGTVVALPADPSVSVLGPFSDGSTGPSSTVLTIDSIPAGTTEVCVTFDLHIIGGWERGPYEGLGAGKLGDDFTVGIGGGSQLYETDFQATDGAPPDATAIGLGFGESFEITVPRTVCDSAHDPNSTSTDVFFGARVTGGNEQWGLSNISYDFN